MIKKFLFVITLLSGSIPALALDVMLPKPGVWYGSIGESSIMLCIEANKSAYYYPGQSVEIDLDIKNPKAWSESVHGSITGHWSIREQGKSNGEPHRIEGEWRKGPGKPAQFFQLYAFNDAPSACSSASYQQTLLIPNEPHVSLTLPQPGQVIATRDKVAVLKPTGELWMWNENQNQPKLVSKDYVRVAMGRDHTLGIKKDGSLWGWGSNDRGQLGGEKVSGEQAVHMGDDFVAIAANGSRSLALKKDGTLWAWLGVDNDAKGNLLGTRKDKPKLIGKSFVSISIGDSSFAAIKNDGTLWMWGNDRDGQLGMGKGNGSWLHVMYDEEQLPAMIGENFSQVSAGYSHTAAIKKDGTLWTWGHGSWGKLGNGTDDIGSPAPIKIGDGFTQVVAGDLNTAAVKADGTLWLWGANQLGMFGDCTTMIHNKPVQIGTNVVQAALGDNFLVALKADGSIWTWGWPWDGDQMDTARACRKQTQVTFADGINKWDKAAGQTVKAALNEPRMPNNIISIAAGDSHSAMVKADGLLLTWGNNQYGQLALGTNDNHNTPQQAGNEYLHVAIDNNQTIALKKDGSLWRWGALPTHYARGDFMKQKEIALAPTKIFAGTIRLLQSGYQSGRGLGIRADGTILDWPYYSDTSKQPVEFGHDVTEIIRGYALKRDGTLWELSQYPISPAPKQIGNNFIHVVSNEDHSYGIKADGSLWAWGGNSMNQLGDGTQVNRADPVNIGSDFVQVAAGKFHGIALAADGSIWTWGNNEVGVLGDDTLTTAARPKKIGSGFAKIAAGDYHNIALKMDGTVWAWGNNEEGQLGDGTNMRRLSPVQIYPPLPRQKFAISLSTPETKKIDLGKHTITSIRTGLYYSCAFFADAAIKCWGSNSDGELGNDRRTTENSKPIVVEQKDKVLSKLGLNNERQIKCLSTEIKTCEKIENRQPFLRGAKIIVDDYSRVCALMPTGKIRCSDRDEGGSSRFVVDGINEAVMFDYRGGHGCALQADERVKCWGDNSHGELGNGTVSKSSYDQVATDVIGLGD